MLFIKDSFTVILACRIPCNLLFVPGMPPLCLSALACFRELKSKAETKEPLKNLKFLPSENSASALSISHVLYLPLVDLQASPFSTLPFYIELYEPISGFSQNTKITGRHCSLSSLYSVLFCFVSGRYPV